VPKIDKTLLQNLKLHIKIQPIASIGLTGELVDLYKVEIEFDRIRYDDDDRSGISSTAFERLFASKEYCGFAPTLMDAVDLAKRFVSSFEADFDRF